ncbi:MAG: Na(+)/H(+) antiporter subunit B [Sulfolobales archaeon]|nr:Na(+)/H(+) antiporter subunit B [Sulfolobales archaeon]MCX8208051.1 Na(+)/H(+) antiporter subunit B [Sulfolobales archaeon]MDW8011215.1 Na(+)/H(+) antiporter subunit B [Sulfolobales archaeon]
MRKYLVLASIVLTTAVVAYVTTYLGALGPLGLDTRYLAKLFLANTYNPAHRELTAMSPEAVTSIVWDFRGIDTLYETVVFYMAIIAALAIYRGVSYSNVRRGSGLSLIVKVVTKLLIPINIAVAVSIAAHGHLTPGGGFQAGAALAVVSVLLAVVYSAHSFVELGVNLSRAVALRSAGLLAIALVVFTPIVISALTGTQAYLMQNYVKVDSAFSFPAHVQSQLISGTLIWFNLAEFLAVSFGFFIIFMLLSLREEVVREWVGKEDEH